ncbi:MAG: FAD-dependent oxidoreductase, partial [bacterium]|nr:FAD-dependent oxidoreductase [bacterium]
IKVLYYTRVADVVRDGAGIVGLVTANKDGLQNMEADVFIDATGDGDMAALAGVPYEQGRQEDGRMQGVTLVFRLGGVEGYFGRCYADRDEVKRCDAVLEQAWKEGKVSGKYHVGCVNSIPGMPGVVAVNSQHTHGIDGTNADDLTMATIKGRREIREMVELFRQHLRGFEKSYLLDTAAVVGVRETRRITGEYTLTEEDVLGARKFEDGIANGAWAIDCHLEAFKPRTEEEVFLNTGQYYNIPYRCLIPKGIDNLLLAGRCISTTHLALAAFRIMSQCMAVGQAAGTAAALCLDEGCKPRNLDVQVLQKALTSDGALFE